MNDGLSRVDTQRYEFDQQYRISYVNYSRPSDLADAQLLLTFGQELERHTFAFVRPHFTELESNIVASKGLYIAVVHDVFLDEDHVEVGDLQGDVVYFTASSVRNITPVQ